MHLLRAAAALALTAALVAACGDDEPKVAPPVESTSDTMSSSASSSVSSGPAAPTKPVLPDAATKPTKAGAEAFIHYYWDVLNYAQATGKVSALREVEAPACDSCAAFAKIVRDIYREGGEIRGGTNSVEITKVLEQDLGSSGYYAVKVTQTVSHDAQTVVHGNGREEQSAEGTDTFVALVVWVDSHWRVDVQDVLPE